MYSTLKKKELVEKMELSSKSSDLSVLYRYYTESKNIHIDKASLRRLFLYVKTKEEISKIEKNFINFVSVLNKLTKYIVFESPQLLEKLGFPGLDVEAIKMRNTGTFISYGRADGVNTENGFKLFEINTRKPQMYEDSDWFSRFINEQYKLNFEVEDNSSAIALSVKKSYEINSGKKDPENIVFLPNELREDFEFSFYNRLKETFPNSNIIVSTVRDLTEQAEESNGDVILNKCKINLIVMQGSGSILTGKWSLYKSKGAIRNEAIRNVYRKGNIEIFPSPTTLISGSKQTFNMLNDSEIIENLKLNNDEIESLSLLPQTFKKGEFDITSLNKNKYVLKTGSGMGAGIMLGNMVNQKVWDAKHTKAHNSKKNFIMQERLIFATDEILDLQTMKLRKAYTTIEPVMINIDYNNFNPIITGYSARAILEEDFHRGMRFNPEHGREEIMLGGVLVVDE
jgi:hypothetical protein